MDATGKVVVIRVEGELSQGKTSDIEFSSVKQILKEKGTLEIKINQSRLTSREYSITEAAGRNKDEIETNVFRENIGQIRLDQKELLSDSGVVLAKKLLVALSMPILENEKKLDYSKRMEQNALDLLELK